MAWWGGKTQRQRGSVGTRKKPPDSAGAQQLVASKEKPKHAERALLLTRLGPVDVFWPRDGGKWVPWRRSGSHRRVGVEWVRGGDDLGPVLCAANRKAMRDVA